MKKHVICYYYLTYRCNARCHFCTIWKDRSIPSTRETPSHHVCRNLDEVKRAGVKVVDFTGGEPLLYPDLAQVLAFAKKIGLRVTLTTNGILYPDRAREITGLVDILQFSIDAATPQRHDACKGVPSFDRVMESIETARSLGERPTIIHTVTNENLLSVPDVITMAQNIKVPLFLNPCFEYSGNHGLSRKGAIQLNTLARGKGVTVDRGFLKFFIDGGNRIDKPLCLAVSSTIVISPDDRLILPCFHYQTKTLPINGKLCELLSSAEVHRERLMEGRHAFCEGCTIYCYIRASLFRKVNRYFLPSLFSAINYIYELYRAPKKLSKV